jgi:hypothetical protein
MNGAVIDDWGRELTATELVELGNKIRKRVRRHEKNCTYIIGSPFSTSQYASLPFVNSFKIGNPVRNILDQETVERFSDNSHSSGSRAIKILHAPSRLKSKGTEKIIASVKALQQSGYPIELKVLRGVSNVEVFREILQSDLIVDQVYSDIPFSVFSCEAAVLGKASVIGGYGFDDMREITGEEMWPPAKRCRPDEIRQAIESLLKNLQKCHDLGQQARDFVVNNLSPEDIAKKYEMVFLQRCPEGYMFDPRKYFYFHGFGQSEEITVSNIENIITEHGLNALGIGTGEDLLRQLEARGISLANRRE